MTPEQMVCFRFIEKTFRKSCLKRGYEEVKTPVLEYLHLFTSTGTLTPSMLNKVYSFLDWNGWSGERLVLRPDGTIPVARLYIENMADKRPARLFYTGNIFRFEETGNENRESWQGGVELIGISSPLADVELMSMAMEVASSVGIKDLELKLSHAGLLRGILSALGLSAKERVQIFDKFLDGDREIFGRIESANPELSSAIVSLMELEGKSSGFIRNIKALFSRVVPDMAPVIDNFIEIVELLDDIGYSYQIDMSSGRGFEYYTGVIFHLLSGEDKICGGGRYDDLIPLMGGGNVPASGFALYFDRMMGLIDLTNIVDSQEMTIMVRTEREAVKEGFRVANELRKAGYSVQYWLGGQEIPHIRWFIDIHGKSPVFVLHDMVSGENFELESWDKVLNRLGECDDKNSLA